MSTEFENGMDVEQLLRSKTWEQLSAEEQAEVKKLLSGRDEYMRMFVMTNQLMSSSGVHDEELKPSAQTRENLLNAFADEQRKRRAAWWSSLWYGLSARLRFDIPIVRIAVAAVVVACCIAGAVQFMDKEAAPQVVKNENVAPVPVNGQQNKETPVPSVDNNVVQQPGNVTPQQAPLQQVQDIPQVAPVDHPDANVNTGVSKDTTRSFIADAVTGNLRIDSALLAPAIATNGMTFCCGTSNGTVIATNAGTVYTWPLNVTNGLPPRARSLENDAAVLDVFFAVK
jgi:hypothetical protein